MTARPDAVDWRKALAAVSFIAVLCVLALRSTWVRIGSHELRLGTVMAQAGSLVPRRTHALTSVSSVSRLAAQWWLSWGAALFIALAAVLGAIILGAGMRVAAWLLWSGLSVAVVGIVWGVMSSIEVMRIVVYADGMEWGPAPMIVGAGFVGLAGISSLGIMRRRLRSRADEFS